MAPLTSLQSSQIVPDVVPASFTSSLDFSVILRPSGTAVGCGEEVDIEQTMEEPDVRFHSEAKDGDVATQFEYTLVMVDPDAPSKAQPTSKEFRHWVVWTFPLPSLSRFIKRRVLLFRSPA